MKIIFLDIDGVLNSRRYDASRGPADGNIDESRLELLKKLTDRTGANLVLTSTWRRHWDPEGKETDEVGRALEETFRRKGLRLWDRTKELGKERYKEVKDWLTRHPETEAFVIFDDQKFGWQELDPYTVKTDPLIGRGLEERHIEKAASLLMREE